MWPRRKYSAAEILSGDAPEPGHERRGPPKRNGVREKAQSYRAPPQRTPKLILALDEELSDQLRRTARARDQAAGELVTELLARGLDQQSQREQAETILQALTPRERQVVAMTGRGQTNRQIGEALVISPETVKTHLRHALSKLGLRSKTELRMLLLDLGIRWWLEETESG